MKHLSRTLNRQGLAKIISPLLIVLLFAACKKDAVPDGQPDQTALEKYSTNLPGETMQELTAAKNATKRYRSLDSAIADGYTDINVVTQNMGFHYMKAALLDTVFRADQPELLVYNKMHDGHIELVAVEYAVPIPLMPNKEPKGFAGGADVWTYSTTFNLWLLHAWVWEYNPLGVFVPTNPNVHLH